MKDVCIVRSALTGDVSFIYNSWLKSFRDGSLWAQLIPSPLYFLSEKKVIDKLILETDVLIACNPESEDQIFGYVVADNSIKDVTLLHYVYVKQPYRGLGFAVKLIENALPPTASRDHVIVASHMTRAFNEYLTKKLGVIYNPYVLHGGNHGSSQTKVG